MLIKGVLFWFEGRGRLYGQPRPIFFDSDVGKKIRAFECGIICCEIPSRF